MYKTILIHDASSPIGKSAAVHFANRDWNVLAVVNQNDTDLQLNRTDNIAVLNLDIKNADYMQRAVKEGIEKFGTIDVLLNSEGSAELGLFESFSEMQIMELYDTNLFRTMRAIKAVLPHFKTQRQGTIINISSGLGRFTLPLWSLYASSKFALEGFSEALSFELAALNINVKIVEPGIISCNLNNLSPPEERSDKNLNPYDDFVYEAGKLLESLHDMERISPQAVAQVIYDAVNDGTDKLRYTIGNEDFHNRMSARIILPDQENIQWIRNGFMSYKKK